MLLNPYAPTSVIPSVSTTVIANFVCCSLHGSSWRLQNHWGKRIILIQTCSMVVELFLMGTSGYRISVVARKGVQNLTVGESHLLLLWLISISRECCSKKSVECLPCNANLWISWKWAGSSLVVPTYIS